MLFSKFSIISIFGITCILKTEKLSFVKKSSVLKKPNQKIQNKTKKYNQKIPWQKKTKPKHKKTPTLEDPFDLTVGDAPVMEGITSGQYFPMSHRVEHNITVSILYAQAEAYAEAEDLENSTKYKQSPYKPQIGILSLKGTASKLEF